MFYPPFEVRCISGQVTLQQENAIPHLACVVMDFLRCQNIHVMEWPAISPDLDPIEHVWDEMHHRLQQCRNPPRTL